MDESAVISTPTTEIRPSQLIMSKELTIIEYNGSNINYMLNESRWKIPDNFFSRIATVTTIPPFSPKSIEDWQDRLKSFLRSCNSLDHLIRDEREGRPVKVTDESESHYQQRIQIFDNRDRALYLILDRSISAAGIGVDPKYLSLSERLNITEKESTGQKLFDGLMFLLKGSHLYARLESINNISEIQLKKIGEEQQVYNVWKRQVDLQNSLQLDLGRYQKLLLINALSAGKEHKAVVLQLVAMTPEELFNLSGQDILNRFLASAGHLSNGGKETMTSMALYAEDQSFTSVKRKSGSSERLCFTCGKPGHYKADCPKRSNKKIKVKKNSN
jgi:hypothetical protein